MEDVKCTFFRINTKTFSIIAGVQSPTLVAITFPSIRTGPFRHVGRSLHVMPYQYFRSHCLSPFRMDCGRGWYWTRSFDSFGGGGIDFDGRFGGYWHLWTMSCSIRRRLFSHFSRFGIKKRNSCWHLIRSWPGMAWLSSFVKLNLHAIFNFGLKFVETWKLKLCWLRTALLDL